MILLSILITLGLLSLLWLRIWYIYDITNEWNTKLSFWCEEKFGDWDLGYYYFDLYCLKHWKYWFRLRIWSVKQMITIEDIYDEINNMDYRKSLKKVK